MILTVDEIIALHTRMTRRTGGSDGLRDRGLLESAVYSCTAAFGGTELYPTTEEKAARLFYALTANHPFVDGNKRIGLLAMLMTLKLGGVEIRHTRQQLIDLTLAVACGTAGYEEILQNIYEWKR